MVTLQYLLVTSPSARHTLRIFHVGKMHPNHSCILIQESYWIIIHSYMYLVKDWIRHCILNSRIFSNFDVYLINRYLTVWGMTIVFSQVPLIKKSLDCSFVDACIRTICHYNYFTRRVLIWENYFTPKQLISYIYSAENRSPNETVVKTIILHLIVLWYMNESNYESQKQANMYFICMSLDI